MLVGWGLNDYQVQIANLQPLKRGIKATLVVGITPQISIKLEVIIDQRSAFDF